MGSTSSVIVSHKKPKTKKNAVSPSKQPKKVSLQPILEPIHEPIHEHDCDDDHQVTEVTEDDQSPFMRNKSKLLFKEQSTIKTLKRSFSNIVHQNSAFILRSLSSQLFAQDSSKKQHQVHEKYLPWQDNLTSHSYVPMLLVDSKSNSSTLFNSSSSSTNLLRSSSTLLREEPVKRKTGPRIIDIQPYQSIQLFSDTLQASQDELQTNTKVRLAFIEYILHETWLSEILLVYARHMHKTSSFSKDISFVTIHDYLVNLRGMNQSPNYLHDIAKKIHLLTNLKIKDAYETIFPSHGHAHDQSRDPHDPRVKSHDNHDRNLHRPRSAQNSFYRQDVREEQPTNAFHFTNEQLLYLLLPILWSKFILTEEYQQSANYMVQSFEGESSQHHNSNHHNNHHQNTQPSNHNHSWRWFSSHKPTVHETDHDKDDQDEDYEVIDEDEDTYDIHKKPPATKDILFLQSIDESDKTKGINPTYLTSQSNKLLNNKSIINNNNVNNNNVNNNHKSNTSNHHVAFAINNSIDLSKTNNDSSQASQSLPSLSKNNSVSFINSKTSSASNINKNTSTKNTNSATGLFSDDHPKIKQIQQMFQQLLQPLTRKHLNEILQTGDYLHHTLQTIEQSYFSISLSVPTPNENNPNTTSNKEPQEKPPRDIKSPLTNSEKKTLIHEYYPLVYVNHTFEKLYQYPREELLGYHDDNLTQTQFIDDQIISQPHSHHESFQCRYLLQSLTQKKHLKVAITNQKKNQDLFLNLLAIQPIETSQHTHMILGIQYDVSSTDASLKDLKAIDDLLVLLSLLFQS